MRRQLAGRHCEVNLAKGNDGNYLQHSVETDAAVRLAAMNQHRGLHIALGHGMAPFETVEQPQNPAARSHLLRALNDSYRAPAADEAPVVTAYRQTNASLNRYPNTAELLRHIVGADRLSGGITEVEQYKHALLLQAWSGLRVAPVHSSWRSGVEPDRALACPQALDRPWLFTLDPMTYREEGCSDDANLYRADLDRLTAVLNPYVTSTRPGKAAVFVYAIKPDARVQFWQFLDDLANAVNADLLCCWVTHRGGNRNLAGLLRSGFSYSGDDLPRGVTSGRE